MKTLNWIIMLLNSKKNVYLKNNCSYIDLVEITIPQLKIHVDNQYHTKIPQPKEIKNGVCDMNDVEFGNSSHLGDVFSKPAGI